MPRGKKQQRGEVHVAANDWHVPYEDKKTLRLFFEFVENQQPGVIHLLGDLTDCYQLATFEKDPARKAHLQDDLDSLATYLHQLRKLAPKARIIFMEGNHEYRLRRWLWRQGAELAGLRCLDWSGLLGLKKLRVKFRSFRDPYKIGHLWFTHGHLIRKHSAYTARAMIEEVGGNVIFGHTHRMGVHHVRNWDTHHGAWENGCLCSLDVVSREYKTGPPNWQQGWSAIYFHNGWFDVHPIHVVNHKYVFNGELFR